MRFRGHLERRHVFAALGALLVIVGFACVQQYRQEEKVYIAFFGRIGDSDYARIHRHALTHYFDELSEETPGYRFVLESFYLDEAGGEPDQPSTLQRLYNTHIVNDDRYALVLDNTWAKHMAMVGTLIRENDIPVLSMNADKGETNFGDYTIFMGHSDFAPTELVTYLNDALDPATVGFVGEKDYWLTGEFLDLQRVPPEGPLPRLEVDYQAFVESQETTDKETATLHRQLMSWYQDAPQPAVLLLNVHNNWGKDIINFVDENLEDVTILAAAYAARQGRADFKGNSGNRLILKTAPEDAVSKRVKNDSEYFRSRYPDDFTKDFNLPFYVKHCLDALEVLRESVKHAVENNEGEPLTIDRELFASFFRDQLTGKSVPGRYDLYTFDDGGRRIPEISFVEFKNDQPTSLWKQLNSKRKIIPTVFFGIDLLDVGRLDPVKGTFHADFYYWINIEGAETSDSLPTEIRAEQGPEATDSSGPSPPKVAGRPVTEYIHFSNLSKETSKTHIDGSLGGTYWLERISAEFNVDFDLEDYPLDTQELTLDLELANPFDDVRVAFHEAAFSKVRRSVENFDIPGWHMVDTYATVDNVVARALRGAAPGQDRESNKYKKLTVRIVTKRKVQSALISVALPLCTIGIAALALLFIRETRFSSVGDVYVGVFLSIITYSIAFAQITPSTGVVTRADYLFYLTFMVVLAVFLRFVALNVLKQTATTDTAPSHRYQKALGFVAVATYLLAILAIAFH